MAALTINGTDVHDLTGIYLNLISGFFEPAEVRGSDSVVTGTNGRIPRDRVKDVRRIVLVGQVMGTSIADWATNTQTLMGLLHPIDACTIAINDSYLGVGSGQSIECRAVNVVPGPIVIGVPHQTWSIEFEAVTNDTDWSA